MYKLICEFNNKFNDEWVNLRMNKVNARMNMIGEYRSKYCFPVNVLSLVIIHSDS